MKEDNQVVKSGSGNNLLLIGTDLASLLDEMVIDFKEAPNSQGFAIEKHDPSE